jgi:hypothetical protein
MTRSPASMRGWVRRSSIGSRGGDASPGPIWYFCGGGLLLSDDLRYHHPDYDFSHRSFSSINLAEPPLECVPSQQEIIL